MADEGTSLYLHLPFCVSKCHYCDFYSVPAEGQDVTGFLRRLEGEIRLRAPARPRTVFLGGGTPSLLSIPQLERLFALLDETTGFRASAREVTVECNPESLSVEKASCLLALGATRLSIGFQSLEDDVLRLFGRAHDVAQSFAAFEAARRAGCANLSIDLIYAYPGLSPERWRAYLSQVLALRPEHLSAYNLSFEEETPFLRWLEQGRLAKQPEELELEQFWATRELASAAGLEAYEISNFASSGKECAHNLNYWHNGDYAGLGPSAVSHVRGARFGNPRSLAEWGRCVEQAQGAPAWGEELGPAQRLAETWWLGLRLASGIEPEAARAVAGVERAQDRCEPLALELLKQGWIEARGPALRLSAAGLPLADAIARRFLAPHA